MFDNIINKIINKPDTNRNKLINSTGIIGIVVNLVLAFIKVVIGISANSIAILSDAINNLSDSVSSIITLIGLKLANKAPNKKHPLGYGRIEYISSLVVATLIMYLGFQLLTSSYQRILEPEATKFNLIQLVILVISIIFKYLLSRINIVVGKSTNSLALQASGQEAKMDVIASILSVVSAIIAYYSGWMIDGYIGLVLSVFIIYTAYQIIIETINSIIGTRPEKSLNNSIKKDILNENIVVGAYDFILHNYGPTNQYGSINLEIEESVSVNEAYMVMAKLQSTLYAKYNIYFTFGLYAINTSDEELIKLKNEVAAIVFNIKHTNGLHAFNVDKINMIMRFDVVVDFQADDFQYIKDEIIKKIKSEYPNYQIRINIDLDYA